MMRSYLLVLFFCLQLLSPLYALDITGRVIDRATLKSDGSANGIAGVKITVLDGKKSIATSETNSHGSYRITGVTSPHFRISYRATGYYPSSLTREYDLRDTASHDVYFEGARFEDRSALASAFLYQSHLANFFTEDMSDSISRLSAFFDSRDTVADYKGIICELLWAEFLSQDRPLESRYYLASALAPMLDSIGWGPLLGMAKYLEVPAPIIYQTSSALRKALQNLAKLPNPADIKKMNMSVSLTSQMANEYLSDPTLSEKAKDRFLVQWKKAWGKDASSFKEDAEDVSFQPNKILSKLISALPDNPEVHYLKGRGLFAAHDFSGAIKSFHRANEIYANANHQTQNFSSALLMEAKANEKINRNKEAFECYQKLTETNDAYSKAQGFRGMALLNQKENKMQDAAANLWKAQELYPSSETVNLLAEISLKFKDRSQIENLLEETVTSTGDAYAHYWLGRYGEENQQTGVAESHYQKAWATQHRPEFAEALSHLYLLRDEYASALALLENVRPLLSTKGKADYALCLLQTGRLNDAIKEFAAAYNSNQPSAKTPELLARYVEALIQNNQIKDAIQITKAYPDQNNSLVKFAFANASIHNHDAKEARLILVKLIKQEETKPEYHFLLGLSYFDENNWTKAKEEFEEALRYRQDYLEATYYCGLASLKMGRADGARNLFNELAQRTSPEWKAKGFLGIGLTFVAQNKPDAAESYFKRSLQTQESAEANAMLAQNRKRTAGSDLWIALAQKAYTLDPNQPKAIAIYGEVLISQGKKSEAISLYQKSLDANPHSCDLLATIAKGKYLVGAYQEVVSLTDHVISACPLEPAGYFYAAVTSDKMQNRKAAEGFFKSYRKSGGDVSQIPEAYR